MRMRNYLHGIYSVVPDSLRNFISYSLRSSEMPLLKSSSPPKKFLPLDTNFRIKSIIENTVYSVNIGYVFSCYMTVVYKILKSNSSSSFHLWHQTGVQKMVCNCSIVQKFLQFYSFTLCLISYCSFFDIPLNVIRY